MIGKTESSVPIIRPSPSRIKAVFSTNFSHHILFSVFFFISFRINSGGPISAGSQRIFWGVGKHDAVSVAGLGNGKKDWDALENIDGERENVRIAAAGK